MFRYKGQTTDLQRIGNDLNVRTVLTGRVVQRGDSLIIGTELVDVANGWRLSGEQYDKKLADLAAVPDESPMKFLENCVSALPATRKSA